MSSKVRRNGIQNTQKDVALAARGSRAVEITSDACHLAKLVERKGKSGQIL